MQHRQGNIERAQNEILHPYGDPERWGGNAELSVLVPAGAASDKTLYGSTIVRAQCADLCARAWETIVFWTLSGLDATDTIEAYVEVRAGAGQNTGKGDIHVASSVFAPTTPPWKNTLTSGTCHLPSRIPACALDLRPWVKVTGDGSVPDHLVIWTCSVQVAPRALL